MARITLKDVTKQYDDVVAVNRINIDIADGEFVTLVGPSGCGKSTTLETIAGLTTPTSGEIHIGDRDVTNLPPKDRGIAMVFQNIALFPHMDVYDNISYGLRLRNQSKDEIDEKVTEAARIVQIEGLLDRMPSELSGGQRQRVAIGRAIVRDPDAFLMDEPLANLDAKLRIHMRTEIARLHKRLETTTVYVTHDQEEAMTMSDRIAVINGGELQQIAPPIECYDHPNNRFVASFIGSPSMNFFDGTVSGGRIECVSFDVDLAEGQRGTFRDGQEVTIGVRPENVFFHENADEAENPTAAIEAQTDVIEPVGDETFVYMFVGADSTDEVIGGEQARKLLMKAEPRTGIDEDQPVEVVFERDWLHVFDRETGDAIAHGIDSEAEQEAQADR